MAAPYYADDSVTLHHGDCLDVMATLPDASVDSVVTDPPYGLEFMGVAWDTMRDDGTPRVRNEWGDFGSREHARSQADAARVAQRKAVAFGEFSQRWAEEAMRVLRPGGYLLAFGGSRTWHRLAVAIEDAGFQLRDSIAWLHGQGFPKGKTQLKPAFEPVVVARKAGPLWLNIDGCRVDANGERFGGGAKGSSGFVDGYESGAGFVTSTSGRWPTNVVLDGHAADELDRQSGVLTSGANPTRRGSDKFRDAYGDFRGQEECTPARGADSGGASRFFPTFRYEAKAPTAERPRHGEVAHPTVKPLDLMRWLVRLVTPPGGTVLEPFAGSGTTAEACVIEGFRCIAIEREVAYLPLIVARLSKPIQPDLFGGAA